MKKKLLSFLATLPLILLLLDSCKKENSTVVTPPPLQGTWPETMEAGNKATYTDASIPLSTGSWDLKDALIGTTADDRKNGNKAARIENTGSLTMNFDVTQGASNVTVWHGVFGNDAASTWALYASTDQGSTWMQVGTTVTSSSATLTVANFTVSFSGNVRFAFRKLSGGRLNLDDIAITDNVAVTIPDNNNYLTLGNPSNAVTSTGSPDNYLLVKPQYAVGYSSAKGEALWVGWHLTASDFGSTDRCDCFATDTQLPAPIFAAPPDAYSGSGFDRGHQCPSGERTSNVTNNAVTFLMSNMLPQAPNLNQITWEALEEYCRTLTVNQGNELYIYSGGYGSGGSGSKGGTTYTLDGGAINVPAYCWKVMVVLPIGNNDLSRITTSTRVIAVAMPNRQSVNAHSWDYYRTSVDAIETATGLDLLPNIPASVQSVLEAQIDHGSTY